MAIGLEVRNVGSKFRGGIKAAASEVSLTSAMTFWSGMSSLCRVVQVVAATSEAILLTIAGLDAICDWT